LTISAQNPGSSCECLQNRASRLSTVGVFKLFFTSAA